MIVGLFKPDNKQSKCKQQNPSTAGQVKQITQTNNSRFRPLINKLNKVKLNKWKQTEQSYR